MLLHTASFFFQRTQNWGSVAKLDEFPPIRDVRPIISVPDFLEVF